MATSVARPQRALPWLLVTVLAGVCLAGCSGGSSDAGNSSPVGSIPEPSGPVATDTVVGLSWQPNSDPVAGYLVYYGPTPASATTLAVQLSLASDGTSAQTPSVSFNAGRDLSLTAGETVCFRLRAYDSGNTLSDWSETACVTI